MMQYKGYTAKVEFDAENKELYGRILAIRDVIDFRAKTIDEVEKEFQLSVDDYLTFCAERNESPDKPYSGKFIFRTDVDTHRTLAQAAEMEGISLNEWLEQAALHSLPPELAPRA